MEKKIKLFQKHLQGAKITLKKHYETLDWHILVILEKSRKRVHKGHIYEGKNKKKPQKKPKCNVLGQIHQKLDF